MKYRKISLFVGLVAFIGIAGISCSANITSDVSVTFTSLPAKEISVTPSITPSPTLLPLLAPTYPTAIPYPTASAVKANAVAFIERDREGKLSLWVANMDGSGERKLVGIAPNKSWIYDQILRWSPDGKWISYFSKDDLWIVSPDGLINKKVLSFPDLYTYVWSPDSSKIAYIQKATYGPVAQITVGILDLVTEKVFEISSHQAPDPMPVSWSPDGKYILFAKDFSYIVYDVATGKIAKEIKPNGMGCWVGWSTWSPNYKWFFDTQHGNGRYSYNWICVSGLDGSNRQINVEGTTSAPVWDKTGNFLYFVARKTNPDSDPNLNIDERLMRYDVRTQKTERLLSLREQQTYDYIQSVSISPDRRTLLLESRFSKTKFDLIFVDIQSLTTTKFTVDFEDLKIPLTYNYFLETAWSPDSQNLVLLAGDVCTLYGCIQYYGSFYTLNVKTGKINIFSGDHPVESWAVSPIAIPPETADKIDPQK